ncbi:MAG TPA: peptidase C69 [Clostridiales bacterium]|nr:peptidase C69 [Clostridiales bacterium]
MRFEHDRWRELSSRALDYLRRKVDYADIRFVSRRGERVKVKNGTVEGVTTSSETGFGVRVLRDGAWGFASSSTPTLEEVLAVADRAVAIAKASGMVGGHGAELSPVEPVEDAWKSPYKEDPFEVKLEDKLEVLLEAEKLVRKGGGPSVRVAEAGTEARREEKSFASTEGSYIEQEITECGAGIAAYAVGTGDMQRRTYPNGDRQLSGCYGWEAVKEAKLADNAERVGREAAQLLEAEPCPSGVTDVILDSTQMVLQIHESCGHPTELDRVFGTEAGYAGTSFLTPDKLGKLRYGSEEVTLVADATVPHGLGTFKYDDEGVPGQRTVLVDKGLFVNYQTSRETAARLGQKSNGTMRADGWNRPPIIRMTNINLEPGDWTLDEMIKDTKDGVLMAVNRSWSIDDRRLNFQFGTEIGWEIKDGSLGRMVKNPNYTGITPEFWASCDAVGDKRHWKLWGTPNCGKGEPPQTAHVGHGSAPARFRRVRVGVGR